jgi:hypothetical protein
MSAPRIPSPDAADALSVTDGTLTIGCIVDARRSVSRLHDWRQAPRRIQGSTNSYAIHSNTATRSLKEELS